jgi:hypothetical protein
VEQVAWRCKVLPGHVPQCGLCGAPVHDSMGPCRRGLGHEQVLRHCAAPSQTDWDRHLPLTEFALNNAEHDSTRTTPFFLNHGQHPMTPVSLTIDTTAPAAEVYTTALHEHVALAGKLLHAEQRLSSELHRG